jgi:hypothetical protein
MSNFITGKDVTLRKARACDGCRQWLWKGESAYRAVCADSGEIWSFYTCGVCQWIWDETPARGEEIDRYGLEDYVLEFVVNPIIVFLRGEK